MVTPSPGGIRSSTWSAVIPYFNEARFIERTLDSLLAQRRRPDVLVLIDNASTDRGPELVRSRLQGEPVKAMLLHEPRPGKVFALETACRHLETEFAMFGDADTFYPDHYIERIDEHWRANPAAACVLAFGVSEALGADERRALIAARMARARRHPTKAFSGGCGHSYRVERLRAAGGYRAERWPYVLEDHEIIHRLKDHGTILHAADTWCEPSPRRKDRSGVTWSMLERNLYVHLPDAVMTRFFYTYLAGRLERRGKYSAKLRTRDDSSEGLASERCCAMNSSIVAVAEAARQRVTVITAMYNVERFLTDTVESVVAQTVAPAEHILVDDASTDGTLALAQRLAETHPNVRVIAHKKNQGFPGTLRTAIAAAKTDYVGILDSDDIAFSNWLADVTPLLEADPAVGAAGGGHEIMTEEGRRTGGVGMGQMDPRWREKGVNPFTHSGTLWRKTTLDDVGSYDPTMHGWEDTELYTRAATRWTVRHCGEVVVFVRLRRASNTARARALWPMLRKILAQREQWVQQQGARIEEASPKFQEAFAALREAWNDIPNRGDEGAYDRRIALAYERGGHPIPAAQAHFRSLSKGFMPGRSLLGGLRGLAAAAISPIVDLSGRGARIE